jgi:hypothetical protein
MTRCAAIYRAPDEVYRADVCYTIGRYQYGLAGAIRWIGLDLFRDFIERGSIELFRLCQGRRYRKCCVIRTTAVLPLDWIQHVAGVLGQITVLLS